MTNDPVAFQQLREEVEKAKIELSSSNQVIRNYIYELQHYSILSLG